MPTDDRAGGTDGFQVAQLNVGRLVAPIDSAELAEFVANLDPVNALADEAPGFVWRLQTDDGNATTIEAFDDPLVIVNMSVWETVDALSDFVFRSDHLGFLRRRREWFERMAEVYLVLWWVPAGHVPTVEEAKARLVSLQKDGPNPEAFTFRTTFPPPNSPGQTDGPSSR